MKKIFFLLFIFIIFSATAFSQKTIIMENYNGVYRVPCIVNGAKMKFIFDTGASNVCISLSMAEYLLDNGFLSEDDIIDVGSSTVADGRLVDHINLNIKDIEIAGLHLYNVKAVVIDGQNAPLLMGQSAIQKLGAIEINGNMLTIKNASDSTNDEFIDKLFQKAFEAYDNNQYARAEEFFNQLYSMHQLSDYGLYLYARSCYYNDNVLTAEKIVNQINDYSYFENKKIDIYSLMAIIAIKLKKYRDAVNYFELSSKKIQTEYSELLKNLYFQGDCYCFLDMYSLAAEKYHLAALLFAKMNNVDMSYIRRDSKNRLKKKEVSFRNDDIDYILYNLFLCYERSGTWSSEDFLFEITAMARAGNKYATKFCNETGINPYSDIWR